MLFRVVPRCSVVPLFRHFHRSVVSMVVVVAMDVVRCFSLWLLVLLLLLLQYYNGQE
jgi:hypothetical protein